jgi:DNA adenine methylase Dam
MTYVLTPFNYTGSKFKLLDQLLPEFDYTKQHLIDVFTGGGSVYTNVIDKYKKVLVNDIITDLIGIHKEILFNEGFIDTVKSLVVDKSDKDGYNTLRSNYNDTPTPEKLYALMLCCTNNMMRFNNSFKFNQTFGERSFNKKTEEKINNWKAHLGDYRNKIVYTSTTFDKIEINNKGFYYLDPPYTNTEAGYNAYWKKDDDAKLIKYCKDIHQAGATFVISSVLNDKENLLIKNLTDAGFTQKILEFDYNKVSRNGKKEIQEVIVKNF